LPAVPPAPPPEPAPPLAPPEPVIPPAPGLPPVPVCPPLPVAVPPAPELPLFWSTMAPVMVGFMLWGVMVAVLAETQYEYFVSPASPESVTTLPELV
jgi:hypothetical protein